MIHIWKGTERLIQAPNPEEILHLCVGLIRFQSQELRQLIQQLAWYEGSWGYVL